MMFTPKKLNYVRNLLPRLNKNQKLLILSVSLSAFGDYFSHLAVLLMLQSKVGGATAIAGWVAAKSAGTIVMGPLAGVWIDRYSRKTLMVLVDLARALLVLLLPFTTSTLQIYLIGLLVSALGVVNSSSRQAVLPNLVERERLTNINSLFSLTYSTIAIVAPTVAGLLIARTKLLAAFAIDAATFVLSAGLIAMISAELKSKLAPTADVKKNFWQIFWQGLVYIVKHPPVRVLVITRMLVALGAGVLQVVFVVYIRETMGWGAERFGFAMSAISVGSVVGASILSIYGQRFSPRWLFAGGTLGVGLYCLSP